MNRTPDRPIQDQGMGQDLIGTGNLITQLENARTESDSQQAEKLAQEWIKGQVGKYDVSVGAAGDTLAQLKALEEAVGAKRKSLGAN